MSDISGFSIDCGSCVMRATDACSDCVVTAILDRPGGAVVFDAAEERAIRTMATAGLLPIVRFQQSQTEAS